MRYKLPLIFLPLYTMSVMAQFSPPDVVRSPTMVFDRHLSDKAVSKSIDHIPISYKINGHRVNIGETTIAEVMDVLKTGQAHYDGTGYYLCYSLPRYNQQLWFVTRKAELNAPIKEITVKLGNTLPTDYCPVITSSTYPKFNNNVRLEANPEYLVPILGQPLYKERITDVYLYQLSTVEKLKVQVSRGRKGVEAIKVSVQELF